MADRQQNKPPAAASRITDEESSNEGDASSELRRSLFALDAMRQRGLIDEATWQDRRRALLEADREGNPGPGTGNRGDS